MKFRPPSWMSTIKMTLPLNVRTVAMSKVLNPVTHTAETLVNKASNVLKPLGSRDISGIARSPAPSSVMRLKLMAKRAGGLSFICGRSLLALPSSRATNTKK